MIGFSLIFATLMVLPGIMAFVCYASVDKPSLQSRPLQPGSSLGAIGFIGFISLVIHLASLAVLFALGLVFPVFEWSLVVEKGTPSLSELSPMGAMGLILYFIFATILGMILPWLFATTLGKWAIRKIRDVSPLESTPTTLSKLCEFQATDERYLLTGYVYFSEERGNSAHPISGVVGGVSHVRLSDDKKIDSIVLLEPIPFVRFINPDTQEKVILEYGDPERYQGGEPEDTADSVITEISAENILEVVFAIFDRDAVTDTDAIDAEEP